MQKTDCFSDVNVSFGNTMKVEAIRNGGKVWCVISVHNDDDDIMIIQVVLYVPH